MDYNKAWKQENIGHQPSHTSSHNALFPANAKLVASSTMNQLQAPARSTIPSSSPKFLASSQPSSRPSMVFVQNTGDLSGYNTVPIPMTQVEVASDDASSQMDFSMGDTVHLEAVPDEVNLCKSL